MLRAVCLVLALGLAATAAEARTPVRVCRKTCKPLVSSVCPPKGKALRKCRTRIHRVCRRQGVAACALGFAPDGPTEDGTTTTTTLPGAVATTTTTSTTVAQPSETTTTSTLPPATVAGAWAFEGDVVERGCGLPESYDAIESSLMVSQEAATLTGMMTPPDMIDGAPASGHVSDAGWTFVTHPDCRTVPGSSEVCCLRFEVSAVGFGSPAGAEGTATAECDGGSSCAARWNGTVTRTD